MKIEQTIPDSTVLRQPLLQVLKKNVPHDVFDSNIYSKSIKTKHFLKHRSLIDGQSEASKLRFYTIIYLIIMRMPWGNFITEEIIN